MLKLRIFVVMHITKFNSCMLVCLFIVSSNFDVFLSLINFLDIFIFLTLTKFDTHVEGWAFIFVSNRIKWTGCHSALSNLSKSFQSCVFKLVFIFQDLIFFKGKLYFSSHPNNSSVVIWSLVPVKLTNMCGNMNKNYVN